jgi:hypothetical protein
MTALQVTFTAGECEFLVSLLEEALKETRIEEHRTRTLAYREHIVQRENLITGVLNKMRQPTASPMRPAALVEALDAMGD